MQQLNTAWMTVQASGKPGASSRSSEATAPRPSRPPGPHECTFCGFQPARPVKLRSITGLVLFYRSRVFHASACRACGLKLFRETQSRTLVRGWWGLFAFFRNLFAIVANLNQRANLKQMAVPQSRASDVLTPLSSPMSGSRKVARRPGPYVATVAAAFVIATIAGGFVAQSQGIPAPDDFVGTCLSADLATVDCTDSATILRVESYRDPAQTQSCVSPQRYAPNRDIATGGGFCVTDF